MKHFAAVAALAVVASLTAVAYSQSASSGTTAASTNTTAQRSNLSEPALQRITQEVRHQLVMLPYYSVFDNLAYKVSPDGTVTLLGQVLDPTLKPDAERVVKKVEGVENVVNNIEVLPTSPNDDRIRRAVYRAIYGNDVLAPYSLRAVPPIHIIVKNGNVTLTGVVARQMDKQIAEMQAKSVPGVFGVTDELEVENSKG
jgi:hyperosmotically inducible periplasmic protein